MSFASPLCLMLLGLAPLLAVLWAREEKLRQARIGVLVDAGLLDAMVHGTSFARRSWRRGLALMGFVLVVVALAGPRVGSRSVLLPAKGLDVLFAVDVSRSMRARDVLPDRLQRAKAEIGAELFHLGQNRVGIVAFAGSAFLQCPLTTDKEAVRLFLNDLSPESIPQGGTSLGAGLTVALAALEAEAEVNVGQKSAGRVVVVVTDGEDHEGGLDEVATQLKQQGVTVILIGVGSTLGEPIPVVAQTEAGATPSDGVSGYLKDRAGNTIMTRMNPTVLTEVATAVGGTFIDGTNLPNMGLREVEARVATLEKRELEARTHVEHEDQTTWAVLAALLCVLLAALLPERARGVSARALP